MSKGTILSGGTGGQYSVAVALDDAAIAVRITVLESRLASLQVDITTADGDLEDLEDVYSALLDEQNALIDAFAADPIKDNLVAINEKTAEAAEAAAAVGTQRAKLAALVADEASTRKEITRLSAAPATVTTSAWCADLTEDLAGDVGLIEVPGGERGQHLQIMPGHGGAAAYSAARDGMLRQPFADVPAATTYNIAMLPGWQKWLPRYRLAEINSIDTEADTCTLTIAAATSGEQGIGVNHATAYSDVPIEYMNCNAQAFAVGDAVLVEFVAQTETGVEGNWAAGKLKVVGFASNPKACDTSTWLCWPSSDGAVFGWGDPYENPPGTPVNPPLGTVQTSYSDAAHIARGIGPGAAVTHGENKIAAMRDWRDSTTPLVVSWDSAGIYSGGIIIKSGNIHAAGVRRDGGTYYLLWVSGLANTLSAQECTITGDAIASVSGPITQISINAITGMRSWWIEFSQDCSGLVLNMEQWPQGGDLFVLKYHKAYTLALPWPFASQTVSPSLWEETQPSSTFDNQPPLPEIEYGGTQKYLVKTQYVANVLTNVWLTITMYARTFSDLNEIGHTRAKQEIGSTVVFDELLQDIDSRRPGGAISSTIRRYTCGGRELVDARYNCLPLIDFGTNVGGPNPYPDVFRINVWRSATDKKTSQTLSGRYGFMIYRSRGDSDGIDNDLCHTADIFCAADKLNMVFLPEANPSRFAKMVSLNITDTISVHCAWCALTSDASNLGYIDFFEDHDIDNMLSIDGETKPRIIIESESRFMGVLKT